MSKSSTIEALLKLSKDKSTTQEERDAAKTAIKALGGKLDDELTTNAASQKQDTKTASIELAKFSMPPWVNDIGLHPCPYQYIVDRLSDRMLGKNREYWHSAITKYTTEQWSDFPGQSGFDVMQVQRDGFRFEVYGGLGFTHIYVTLGESEKKDRVSVWDHADKDLIEIYSSSYAGGWRDGPWWAKLDKLVDKWIPEADAIDVEEARKRAAAKQAEQDAKDNLFSRYVRENK